MNNATGGKEIATIESPVHCESALKVPQIHHCNQQPTIILKRLPTPRAQSNISWQKSCEIGSFPFLIRALATRKDKCCCAVFPVLNYNLQAVRKQTNLVPFPELITLFCHKNYGSYHKILCLMASGFLKIFAFTCSKHCNKTKIMAHKINDEAQNTEDLVKKK